jgi:hypothetical protein
MFSIKKITAVLAEIIYSYIILFEAFWSIKGPIARFVKLVRVFLILL